MNITDLQTLFPTAQISFVRGQTSQVYSIPFEDHWILIPKSDVTDREKILLQHISFSSTLYTKPSQWLSFIQHEDQPIPTTSSSIRMVQLQIDFRSSELDRSFWTESIRSLFDHVLEVCFYAPSLCVIIQSQTDHQLSLTELSGILQTLEEDYSVNLTTYLGRYWPVDSSLHAILNEEIHIFDSQSHSISKGILTLSDIALHYFTTTNRQNSVILSELKTHLVNNPEWIDVIQALWHNQRNLSETAKSLYIHRNTLQYRMEKFTEATHISLKETNELLLAYLLTI